MIHYFRHTLRLFLILAVFALGSCVSDTNDSVPDSKNDVHSITLRVATYNIEDVRTENLLSKDHPRLQAIAAVIQRIRPDILLLNELAYDQPGALGYEVGDVQGLNARRFVENYLAIKQEPDLKPITYRTFAAPSNTGIASGYDFDNSGVVVSTFPEPPPAGDDGAPGQQTAGGRLYGNDAWGFGTFPGQYAMALLVREDLEILTDDVRTFQHMRWGDIPGALVPGDPTTQTPWYSPEAWNVFRLSSKSHWDVPVRLPDGTVFHVLASHPTPPAFDGPERRNVKRNHDEIRFWADYIDGATYIVDDSSGTGGLPDSAAFVILGDLNADVDEGNSIDNPVETLLLSHPRINGSFVPQAGDSAAGEYSELSSEDTAVWGMRVDYVLPSNQIEVLDGGIFRPDPVGDRRLLPSDHFLVWLDVGLDKN